MKEEDKLPALEPTEIDSEGIAQAAQEGDGPAGGAVVEGVPHEKSTAEQAEGRDAGAPESRGRGRGRGRVKPRVVPRKKPPTRIVIAPSGPFSGGGGRGSAGSEQGRGGSGRGRGGGSGRGRGYDHDHGGQHSANVIGLGQIAPQRVPASTVSGASGAGSTAGSAASRKSSAMATQSSVGGSVSRASGLSFGSSGGTGDIELSPNVAGPFSEPANDEDTARNGAVFGERRQGCVVSRTSDELVGENSDSDDDLPPDDLEHKNQEVASFVGKVSDGMLLPMSLPSLRHLDPPPTVSRKSEDAFGLEAPRNSLNTRLLARSETLRTERTQDAPITTKRYGARVDNPVTELLPKLEPLEVESVTSSTPQSLLRNGRTLYVPDVGKPVDSWQFPPKSSVRHILDADRNPALLQLPGLLPLKTRESACGKSEVLTACDNKDGNVEMLGTSLSIHTRDMRLGTDIRQVGTPGAIEKIGRFRLYRSGRAELVFNDGSTYDVSSGVSCKTNQQLVALNFGGNNRMENSCEEIANALTSRLVCTPSLESLVSNPRPMMKTPTSFR
jgi:hypothetical protein